MTCLLRALQSMGAGATFWLWSSRDIFPWLIYQNGLFLLKGFWWDVWPPGPTISLCLFSFFSWRIVCYSGFISSDCFPNYTQVRGWEYFHSQKSELLSESYVWQWGAKLCLLLLIHTDACISGRYLQGPGVSETLSITNLVWKICIYPVNVSRILCKSEGWGQFSW